MYIRFENFEYDKLHIKNYNELSQNMRSYPYNSDKMSKDYLELFESLLNNKLEILSKRSIPKNLVGFFIQIY